MIRNLSEVFISMFIGFDESINWNRLRKARILSESELKAYQWENVRELYICGTVGREDYTANEYGFGGVFGAVNIDGTQVGIFGAGNGLINEMVSHCSARLETLHVRFTDCESLDVSWLAGLGDIKIESNSNTAVSGLSELRGLRSVDISDARIGSALDISGWERLKEIYLIRVPVREVAVRRDIETVKFVQLADTNISDYGFLERFPRLSTLSLSAQSAVNLDGVKLPDGIKRLYLHDKIVTRLPESIRNLKQLDYLELWNLRLDTLPDWLPELGLSFHGGNRRINMFNTTVADMDMSLFDQSDEVIRAWFRNRAAQRGGPKPLNEAKVIFLGDGEAGKTHIIRRIMNGCEPLENFDGTTTPGIAFEHKEYTRQGRTIKVHFWDFGGQEIFHSMHRMFLTQNTMYVVVLNARGQSNDPDSQARYWLHNIKSFTRNRERPDEVPPVLLVLNKIDANPSISINLNGLRSFYCPNDPDRIKEVKLSAKEFSTVEFRIGFESPLLDELFRLSIINTSFTPAWSKLKDKLLEMDRDYITDDDYVKFCNECGVEPDPKIREDLLKWFNDLGVSFCYRDSLELSDYMVLRPKWITNAINTVLFNKKDVVKNGIITKDEIVSILHPSAADRDKIKTVDPNMSYKVCDVRYVLGVTREFRLSYAIDDDREFMPMLCGRNQRDIAVEYEQDPAALELRMKYDYLPNNVLHRLMVELHSQLDMDNVWLTGAIFRAEPLGLSALVKIDGDTLRIYVRGENDTYSANTYLGEIKSAVEGINRHLGICSTSYIEYKNDGKCDSFKYDMILKSKKRGNKDVYSEVFDDNISLDAILDKSVRPEDNQWNELRSCVLRGCISLQANSKYYDASEDERNTYMRDLIRGHYTFADQSFHGLSASGRSMGKPDGVILDKSGSPISIYEGLNVTGVNIADWNDHLNKLINPHTYNPNGLKRLFLVSYVKCASEKFMDIWDGFQKHMAVHSPDGFSLKLYREGDSDTNYLKYAQCVYSKGGCDTTVCCVFVRVGGNY